MTVYSGPRTQSQGMLLHLDAGSPNSFTSGATTWKDLSGGGYNATMYGTVPFETDIVPCFNFGTATGTASYNTNMGFTFGGNMVPTTGDFTFSCWIKNAPSVTSQVGLFSNAGGGDGYRFGVSLNTAYFLIYSATVSGTENHISFSGACSASQWYNIAMVYGRSLGNMILYRNGLRQGTFSISAYSQSAFTATTPGMVRSPCCSIYTGKLASFTVYGKAITDDEALQNFDTLKGRFGY